MRFFADTAVGGLSSISKISLLAAEIKEEGISSINGPFGSGKADFTACHFLKIIFDAGIFYEMLISTKISVSRIFL